MVGISEVLFGWGTHFFHCTMTDRDPSKHSGKPHFSFSRYGRRAVFLVCVDGQNVPNTSIALKFSYCRIKNKKWTSLLFRCIIYPVQRGIISGLEPKIVIVRRLFPFESNYKNRFSSIFLSNSYAQVYLGWWDIYSYILVQLEIPNDNQSN